MILGTAAYMSPEQARGKPVDRRARYLGFRHHPLRMLTGRHPYGTGETVTDTLAAIVLKEPDLQGLPADTPPRLRRLIHRCLRKEPKVRLRDIGEARVLLDEPETPAAAVPPARRAWLPWAVAGASLAIATVAAGSAWLWPKPGATGEGIVRFTLVVPGNPVLPGGNAASNWVPSPDGKNLAMIVADAPRNMSLWVRPLSATSPHRLDKTDDANLPFWSPDGKDIAFFAEGKLKRVPAAGGAVQTICETRSPGGASGDGGTWNREGVIVFAAPGSQLMQVPAAGGTPTPLTSRVNERSLAPQFLPDSRHFIYLVQTDQGESGVYAQELGSSRRTLVLKTQNRAMWAPPGYLLFTRESALFAQRMDPKTFQLSGDPLLVADDVTANRSNGRSTVAVSESGLLVYRTGSSSNLLERQLQWLDRDGKVLQTPGKPLLIRNLSLSPDGKNVALVVGQLSGLDVLLMDLATGVVTPMTNDARAFSAYAPAWSSDSRRIAISIGGGGVEKIDVTSGKATRIVGQQENVEDWSPDGRTLISRDDKTGRISVIPADGPFQLQPVLVTPNRQTGFRFSPDGKYVAYMATEGSQPQVYVASFPTFATKRKISTAGGSYPAWARGGRTLFYRALDGNIMEVDIRTGADIEAGTPKPLFRFGSTPAGNRFGVSADGNRFLVAEYVHKEAVERAELTIVLNWAADLKH